MDVLASIETVMDSDLVHHGRKGQKWGVRNGPPYPLHPEQLSSAEKKARRSVFISGSSKTQDPESWYYRDELPKAIQNKIDEYMQDHAYIVVGDAPGIDRQVQDYLNEKGYDAVEVYGPGKQVRYTANEKWKTNPVDAPEYEEMSPEWLRKKDIAMTNDATEGLAIVLDEGAKATRNNVERLREQGKAVDVYVLTKYWDDYYDFSGWETEPGSYQSQRMKYKYDRSIYAHDTQEIIDDILSTWDWQDEKWFNTSTHEPGFELVKRGLAKTGEPKEPKTLGEKLKQKFTNVSVDDVASFCDLVDYGSDYLNVEIGTKRGDKYRNKGYGYKAAKEALDWVEQNKDSELLKDYDRIVWQAYADNYGSIKIAEKLGFDTKEEYTNRWGENEVRFEKKIRHSDFLSHHGVQGQQWGVRHWQNPDGTLTPAGRERWINSLKYEAYQAAKKWEEYQKVRKQVVDMHYNGQFDSKLEKQMRDLKEEANKAGAIWGFLRKRVESYLENGPESSTSEPATDAPHKVLVAVGDEERYKHFLDLGYVEKGRNDTWIYMINTDKYIRHSEEIQNDVLAAVEEVIDEDAVHHQRLGAKWGLRNGPPYPLKPDQLSARERMLDENGRNIAATGDKKKWQNVEILESIAKHKYVRSSGFDNDKLTKAGRKHLQEMLDKAELKEYGKRKRESKERSLSKAGLKKTDEKTREIDNVIIRRAAGPDDKIDDRRKYVSITEADAGHYDQALERGFLPIEDRENITVFEYGAKRKLKVADADEVISHIVDTYGSKRERQVYEDIKQTAVYKDVFSDLVKSGNASAADLAVASYVSSGATKYLRNFLKQNLWDGTSYSGQSHAGNKQAEIFDYYKKQGYDAIVDVEDYLGRFEYPLIIMDPSESLKLKGKHKHSDYSLSKSYKLSHGDADETFLAHYQRKGAKWGIRNGPPYPLDRSQFSEAEREADPDTEAKQHMREAGIKRKNRHTDIIKRGSTFVRQATKNDEKFHDRKYMSVTESDADYYRKEYRGNAEYVYEAKRDLKVANADSVVDYIVNDMMGYRNSEEGKKLSSLYEKYLSKPGQEFTEPENKERYKFFSNVISKQRAMYGREEEKHFDTHRQILDHFSSLGYDAIVDINQSWQGMEYPVIIIDPDDSTKLKTKIVRRFLLKDKVVNY